MCHGGADSFSANEQVDSLFAELLLKVKEVGVLIKALRISVDEIGMKVEKGIPAICEGME